MLVYYLFEINIRFHSLLSSITKILLYNVRLYSACVVFCLIFFCFEGAEFKSIGLHHFRDIARGVHWIPGIPSLNENLDKILRLVSIRLGSIWHLSKNGCYSDPCSSLSYLQQLLCIYFHFFNFIYNLSWVHCYSHKSLIFILKLQFK